MYVRDFLSFVYTIYAKITFLRRYNSFLEIDSKNTKESPLLDVLARLRYSDITISTHPYPHIVIDNYLQKDAYSNLEDYFSEKITAPLSVSPKVGTFYPFEEIYGDDIKEGCVYGGPVYGENKILNYLFFKRYITFFGKVLQESFSFTTSIAVHHHKPGDSSWSPHTDFETLLFDESKRLKNGVLPHFPLSDNNAVPYTRVYAAIVYLCNNDYAPGKGGGTALYSNDDASSLVKVIEPKNNRLLLFKLSPKAFHGFEANAFPRTTLIQWFYE